MIRATLNRCWIFFAVITIVLALLITSARFLLPYLDNYHQQIEATISSAVGATVEVRSIEAAWHGIGPQLKIRGVRVLNGDTELLRFAHGSVGLDLWQSLKRGALQIGSLVVSGAELVITRDEAGKIGVAGFEAMLSQHDDSLTQHKSDDGQALLRWLFAQPRMAIESSNVTWRDLKLGGRELHFTNVAFELRNQDGRHQLDGAAELPIHLGQRLSFSLDIRGNPSSERGWSADGYVEGGELQLSQWLEGQAPAGVRVDDGLVETRLWLEWQDAVLQRVEGDLLLSQLLLTPVGTTAGVEGREPMVIERVSGRYEWQRNAAGWSLTIDDFMLGRDNRMWPPSQLSVATSGWRHGEQIVEVRLGYARIDDVLELLQMSDLVDDEIRQQLLAFAPTGELRNGYLHFYSEEASHEAQEIKQKPRYMMACRFDNIKMNAIGKLPGASGIDGRMKIDNRGGYLALESSDAALSFPTLFREPLAVTALTGDLYWQRDGDKWQVESRSLQLKNSDAEFALALALSKDDGVPAIALLADFNAPSVANISHYLPVGIMPGAVVEWLDRAIIDGNAAAGQMVFYGPLDDRFPYTESDGLFDIRFNLTEGILDYAPGWPRLEEMEAEVIFSGRRMEINAVAAKSLNADVTEVVVKIGDFQASPVLLEIDGKGRGDARDTLDFVRRTPLNEKFGQFVEDVEVTAGRSTIDLSIDLPLSEQPATVNGTVHFEQADFYLAERAVDLLAVNGALQFSEKGVKIDQMQARLLEMEVALRAQTLPASQGGATVISADGKATAADIRRLLPSRVLQQIDGETQWQAQFTLLGTNPETISTEADMGGASTLRITSMLQGMAFDLPRPLGKSAAQSEEFVVEVAFPGSRGIPMQLQYGTELRGTFDLDEAMGLQRGAITFGGALPVLPEKALISVDGRLSSFSLDEWMPIFELAEQPGGRDSLPVEIAQLNLEIEQMSAFGIDFHYTAIEIAKAPGVWQGKISNHLIGGQLQVPTDFERDVLEMTLDYLILPGTLPGTAEDGSGTAVDGATTAISTTLAVEADPRRLPALKINSRYFSYAGLPLGTLQLLTTRRQSGLHVDQLQLLSPLVTISARGDWAVVNETQYSSFNIQIDSDDLGKVMSTLGFADSIREGKSEIDIIARWPGPPAAFAMERLSGNMHLNVEDGRLLDVAQGAGRVFGLISLQALPRRLTLDFSDIFKKGFSFDSMEGDFEINDGNATTTNFRVIGPSATIMTRGRVGLAAKDYNQRVTVEPHVTSSLPVVGAVVGSLGIGAAILLAQKLLKLDEVTQVTYRVTGPWNEPVVVREGATVSDSEAER